jgi:hypothetical protein
MSTEHIDAQKRTDPFDSRAAQRERAQAEYHDAMYLGTDERGHVHFWSVYHQAVVRFEPDGDVTTLNFPADKFLPEYLARVASAHDGWADGPRYDDSDALSALDRRHR